MPVRTMVERWHEEVITEMVRDMQLAGRFAGETATSAAPWRSRSSTTWTRRKMEPNREHALEVLADSWYHLLCDEA